MKNKKDKWGHTAPVQIEEDEWWFNGRIIQRQVDDRLPTWISFADDDTADVVVHSSKKDAAQYCLNNPCANPKNKPNDYL